MTQTQLDHTLQHTRHHTTENPYDGTNRILPEHEPISQTSRIPQTSIDSLGQNDPCIVVC